MSATLFTGGVVWTGRHDQADTDAVLVVDGVVVTLGDDARTQGAQAETVDLAGGFLMPSFGDGHAHPLYGGLEAVGPAVRPCTSVDEIVLAVKQYAEEHPDEEWIVGASYDGSLAPGGLFDARWLDAAVPDRPVVLRAWDYHTVWCNSVALERAGITADTPDPVLGEIPRRDDGSVLGTLREWGATDLVMAVMPPRDEQVRIAALDTAADYYLARGVTWVQDAWVEPADVATYVEAARRGALRMRFNLALYADPRHFDSQVTHFAEQRRAVADAANPLLTANTVKFFADGVVENETGALLQPYCSGLHSHGMRNWEGDSLAEAARQVDDLGLQIHIHAIGDAAVRQALDAIEHVVRVNGPRDRRPVIAHCQLIDDADLARFAALGVIPNMQPLWAQLDALMTVLTVPRLGVERADKQYPIRTLDTSGAPLGFGSDWPVSSGAPFDGIAVATSRRTSDGEPDGGWTPHEILPIERALSAYTAGAANQAFADNDWGVLTPGASADLIWLDRDPRATAPLDLPTVAIRATYLRGAPAYRAENGADS
ncbi:amidohydrolase [Mycolicibacterium chlorophenolicum]|uniref:N-substituted formamide deformylase n=1 Tax=Mycolicibacterium chlorophenolicum TaxID=37916 RepID=A0A0J6WHN9_9MYCO|nr:amidohydrolase [Mycolicibacterium chlorophenolicum]KMO82795.1 N-substituted formamide deformylase precursor [Mycolicibacterium chlorophenolicum]